MNSNEIILKRNASFLLADINCKAGCLSIEYNCSERIFKSKVDGPNDWNSTINDHVSNSTQSRRYQKSQSRQSAKVNGPKGKTWTIWTDETGRA